MAGRGAAWPILLLAHLILGFVLIYIEHSSLRNSCVRIYLNRRARPTKTPAEREGMRAQMLRWTPSAGCCAQSSRPSAAPCSIRVHGIRAAPASAGTRRARIAASAAAVAAPEKIQNKKKPAFPFTCLAGQEDMKLALLLNVVDPNIGGVLIMGDRGTGKSVAVSGAAQLPGRRAGSARDTHCQQTGRPAACAAATAAASRAARRRAAGARARRHAAIHRCRRGRRLQLQPYGCARGAARRGGGSSRGEGGCFEERGRWRGQRP